MESGLDLTFLIGILFLLRSLALVDQKDKFFLFFISTLSFLPLYISLWQGQDTAFLFLGVAFWCIGILKKQDWLIGVGIAFATVRPHISIALALPPLIRHSKSWWRYLLPTGMLAITSVIMLDFKGTAEFINLLLISSEGNWFGMNLAAMLNLLGLFLRIFQLSDSDTISIIGWLIYLTSLALICTLWKFSKMEDVRLISLTILIACITAPHLHLHDLTLLIFPILFIVKDRSAVNSDLRWLMLPVMISLFLVLGLLLNEVYYIIPYIVFLFLGWLILSRKQNPPTAIIPNI